MKKYVLFSLGLIFVLGGIKVSVKEKKLRKEETIFIGDASTLIAVA